MMEAGTGRGLHSRDGQKLLKSQFNKMPELRNVYDNIDSYTDDDIENLPYRPWVKKELRKYKKKLNNADALARAEKIAKLMRDKTQKT